MHLEYIYGGECAEPRCLKWCDKKYKTTWKNKTEDTHANWLHFFICFGNGTYRLYSQFVSRSFHFGYCSNFSGSYDPRRGNEWLPKMIIITTRTDSDKLNWFRTCQAHFNWFRFFTKNCPMTSYRLCRETRFIAQIFSNFTHHRRSNGCRKEMIIISTRTDLDFGQINRWRSCHAHFNWFSQYLFHKQLYDCGVQVMSRYASLRPILSHHRSSNEFRQKFIIDHDAHWFQIK